MALVVESAAPDRRAEACRWLFASRPYAEHAARRFEQFFAIGELDPAGLLVALDHGNLVGVQFAYRIGGGQGAFWPPAANDTAIEDALVTAGLNWLCREPTRVIQSLVAPVEQARAAAFLRAGFRTVTSLAFLSRTCRADDTPARSWNLRFRRLNAFDDAFVQLLIQTYEGTQDVPELNGRRTEAEILGGFRELDPSHSWWLEYGGERVGLLILALRSDDPTVELSYVGLVPQARGRGLGGEAVDFAIAESALSARHSIQLNVDVRNEPALRIYHDRMFRTDEVRKLYLWFPG